MKCFQLKLKSKNRLTDPVFMAQVPIMPSMFLVNLHGANLGLLQKEGDSSLLLITDNDGFIERYLPYYQERFEVTEFGDDYVVPYGYEVVYGSVKFDNEAETSEQLEAAENELLEEIIIIQN